MKEPMQIIGGHLTAQSFATGEFQEPVAAQLDADVERAIAEAPPNEPEVDPERMIAEAAEVAIPAAATPRLPGGRPECQTAMDTKHAELDALKAKLTVAAHELDALIALYNRLPK